MRNLQKKKLLLYHNGYKAAVHLSQGVKYKLHTLMKLSNMGMGGINQFDWLIQRPTCSLKKSVPLQTRRFFLDNDFPFSPTYFYYLTITPPPPQ